MNALVKEDLKRGIEQTAAGGRRSSLFGLNFTIGKYYGEKDRVLIPLSVQAHHAACDGFHTARLVNEVQKWPGQFQPDSKEEAFGWNIMILSKNSLKIYQKSFTMCMLVLLFKMDTNDEEGNRLWENDLLWTFKQTRQTREFSIL